MSDAVGCITWCTTWKPMPSRVERPSEAAAAGFSCSYATNSTAAASSAFGFLECMTPATAFRALAPFPAANRGAHAALEIISSPRTARVV